MDRETFLDLIPAYALGALDEHEQAEIESRLADDAEAQALLAEYQTLTQALSLTTTVRPAPAHLGDDLRRRVAASKPPVTPAVLPVRRSPLHLRWLAAAAVLAVVIGVVGGLALLRPQDETVCPNTQSLYQQIIASPNYVRIALAPGDEFADISGDLVADPTQNAAILHMKHLPTIQPDQTFQLWLAGPDQTVSGGLFQRAADDTCIVLPLEYGLDQYNGFGVALEPAGGSPNPNQRSGPRVASVRLGDA
ncbi:MAG: anti-sigma factor [Anaerolineae bacterium]|nr:anti-sigma factor [Anaerolineae bacterium]